MDNATASSHVLARNADGTINQDSVALQNVGTTEPGAAIKLLGCLVRVETRCLVNSPEEEQHEERSWSRVACFLCPQLRSRDLPAQPTGVSILWGALTAAGFIAGEARDRAGNAPCAFSVGARTRQPQVASDAF